jgi:hypothetical protein
LKALSGHEHSAFQGVNQILGVQFELLQLDFFNLFLGGEIGLFQQLFQPLSVATMFRVQAIELFAQRGIQNFIHQAPPNC